MERGQGEAPRSDILIYPGQLAQQVSDKQKRCDGENEREPMNRGHAAQVKQGRSEKVIQGRLVCLIKLISVGRDPVTRDVIDHDNMIIVIEKTHVGEDDQSDGDPPNENERASIIMEKGAHLCCRQFVGG